MFDLGNRKFLEFHVLPLMDKLVSRCPARLLAFHLQCHGHPWEHEALFCSSAPNVCQGGHGPCRIPPSIYHFDESPDEAQVTWHQLFTLRIRYSESFSQFTLVGLQTLYHLLSGGYTKWFSKHWAVKWLCMLLYNVHQTFVWGYIFIKYGSICSWNKWMSSLFALQFWVFVSWKQQIIIQSVHFISSPGPK